MIPNFQYNFDRYDLFETIIKETDILSRLKPYDFAFVNLAIKIHRTDKLLKLLKYKFPILPNVLISIEKYINLSHTIYSIQLYINLICKNENDNARNEQSHLVITPTDI
jgi:hypothetical protein